MAARYNHWILTTKGPAKICNGCGCLRLQREYSRDKSTGTGYKSRCRFCVAARTRQWVADNPERKREADRHWLAQNLEHRREWARRYRHTALVLVRKEEAA